MILREFTGETFNEATGEVTGGSNTDHPAYGLIVPAKQGRREDTTGVEKYDFGVMLSAENDSGPLSVVPDTSMTLVIGGTTYQIAEAEPLRPGGVDVLYDIKAVR